MMHTHNICWRQKVKANMLWRLPSLIAGLLKYAPLLINSTCNRCFLFFSFFPAECELFQAKCFQMGVWKGHMERRGRTEYREREQWGSVKSILLYWRGHFLSGFWGIKCVCLCMCVHACGVYVVSACREQQNRRHGVLACCLNLCCTLRAHSFFKKVKCLLPEFAHFWAFFRLCPPKASQWISGTKHMVVFCNVEWNMLLFLADWLYESVPGLTEPKSSLIVLFIHFWLEVLFEHSSWWHGTVYRPNTMLPYNSPCCFLLCDAYNYLFPCPVLWSYLFPSSHFGLLECLRLIFWGGCLLVIQDEFQQIKNIFANCCFQTSFMHL